MTEEQAKELAERFARYQAMTPEEREIDRKARVARAFMDMRLGIASRYAHPLRVDWEGWNQYGPGDRPLGGRMDTADD